MFTNKYSILISNTYLQTFCSFQLTCRFHMPFFIFKVRIISSQQIEHFWWLDLQKFRSFQLNFRFCFPFLIFQVQIISAQQIEQFWCLENYELFVSAEKQLADPLFSSYSVVFWLKQDICYCYWTRLSDSSKYAVQK